MARSRDCEVSWTFRFLSRSLMPEIFLSSYYSPLTIYTSQCLNDVNARLRITHAAVTALLVTICGYSQTLCIALLYFVLFQVLFLLTHAVPLLSFTQQLLKTSSRKSPRPGHHLSQTPEKAAVIRATYHSTL